MDRDGSAGGGHEWVGMVRPRQRVWAEGGVGGGGGRMRGACYGMRWRQRDGMGGMGYGMGDGRGEADAADLGRRGGRLRRRGEADARTGEADAVGR
jgi:hypothetical protein